MNTLIMHKSPPWLVGHASGQYFCHSLKSLQLQYNHPPTLVLAPNTIKSNLKGKTLLEAWKYSQWTVIHHRISSVLERPGRCTDMVQKITHTSCMSSPILHQIVCTYELNMVNFRQCEPTFVRLKLFWAARNTRIWCDPRWGMTR